RLQQGRLPGAVAPEQRQPVAVAELEVDRPDPEAVSLDDRVLEPRDHVAAPRAGCERELQLPGRPRLLDLLQLAELLGRLLLHVFRLLLLAALAVAAPPPLPHPPRLFVEALALGDVACVRRLVPVARGHALGDVLAPAARVHADAPGLGLELDDAGHPLEERAVVRNGDEPAAVRVDEPLEQLE